MLFDMRKETNNVANWFSDIVHPVWDAVAQYKRKEVAL